MSSMIRAFLDIISPNALAVVTGSFLSGCMMGVAAMTVPILLETTNDAAQLTEQWGVMYNYGFPYLPTISVATCSLYAYTAFARYTAGSSWEIWAAAGVTTVTMLPFTWIFMWPTNDTLFLWGDESKAGKRVRPLIEVQKLVRFWQKVHFLRGLFPLTGAFIGLTGTMKGL